MVGHGRKGENSSMVVSVAKAHILKEKLRSILDLLNSNFIYDT